MDVFVDIMPKTALVLPARGSRFRFSARIPTASALCATSSTIVGFGNHLKPCTHRCCLQTLIYSPALQLKLPLQQLSAIGRSSILQLILHANAAAADFPCARRISTNRKVLGLLRNAIGTGQIDPETTAGSGMLNQ